MPTRVRNTLHLCAVSVCAHEEQLNRKSRMPTNSEKIKYISKMSIKRERERDRARGMERKRNSCWVVAVRLLPINIIIINVVYITILKLLLSVRSLFFFIFFDSFILALFAFSFLQRISFFSPCIVLAAAAAFHRSFVSRYHFFRSFVRSLVFLSVSFWLILLRCSLLDQFECVLSAGVWLLFSLASNKIRI